GQDWDELKELTRKNLDQAGLQAPGPVLALARRLLRRWTPLALLRNRQALSSRLARTGPVEDVEDDFCLYGIMTAHFWRCFDDGTPSWAIARCLKRITNGPLLNMDTRPDWGVLEFSQSSSWPLQLLDVRLVQDHLSTCSLCPRLAVPALRRRLRLEDAAAFASASPAVRRQLAARPTQPAWTAQVAPVRLVVIGSHMGSNMEPLAMVEACVKAQGLELEATVLGTAYPFPDIICESFGHCSKNAFIDEAVRLLVRQMYRPSWEPAKLLDLLWQGLQENLEADIFLCAQPMALCSFLRSLTSQPMILYQAFPLVGATPLAFRQLLLVQLREVQVANGKRSALIAYSEFLARQVQKQTGQRPFCLRPHSLYAVQAGRYFPDRESPRILLGRMAGWARNSAGAMVRLVEAFAELLPTDQLRLVFLGLAKEASGPVAGIARPFSYSELRRFRGAVYFPWDMGMLVFSELYAIGVPLFLPDRAWISSIIKRMLEYTDFGWWQAREEGSAVALPGATPGWFWFSENSTISEILELYDLTDFVRWPYVTSFSSLPQLMQSLVAADFDSTSQAMMRWNDASLPLSLDILSQMLGAMLSNSTAPPVASTCV
ncbi:unnamed protein product, partial [Effrenium voratum]